jgi:hypothetical protein
MLRITALRISTFTGTRQIDAAKNGITKEEEPIGQLLSSRSRSHSRGHWQVERKWKAHVDRLENKTLLKAAIQDVV